MTGGTATSASGESKTARNPSVIATKSAATGGWVLMSKAGYVPPSGAARAAIQIVANSWNLKGYVDDFRLK